jgi:hypothetical protein
MTHRMTIACQHQPEVHVLYDKLGSGYRAEIRCPCRKVHITLSRIRDRVDQAEADGAAMMALAKGRKKSLAVQSG